MTMKNLHAEVIFMRPQMALLLLLLSGCGKPTPLPLKTYSVSVVKPDGTVHNEYTIECGGKPKFRSTDGGNLYLEWWDARDFLGDPSRWYSSEILPVGWGFKVEPLAESNNP